jgi:molybdopterin/thiamine biosynthesis adenylyltransferase
MDDSTLLRYSRHLLLEDFGVEGQERLLAARVLVIGLGGLGCPAAAYLATAGAGHVDLVDDDLVELTNLQRQMLHTTSRIGQPKVDSAQTALHELNPGVAVRTFQARADAGLLDELAPGCTVVLDCSDNIATRHAVNAACVRHRVPLVSGAASGHAGQLAVFDLRDPDSPCYACLFPPGEGEDEPCASTGVFAPLTGVVGAMMAGEAMRVACGAGSALAGAMLVIDARGWESRRIRISCSARCAVCGRVA